MDSLEGSSQNGASFNGLHRTTVSWFPSLWKIHIRPQQERNSGSLMIN